MPDSIEPRVGDVDEVADAVPGLAEFRNAIAAATSDFWLISKADVVLIAVYVAALLARDAAAAACLNAHKPVAFYPALNKFIAGRK